MLFFTILPFLLYVLGPPPLQRRTYIQSVGGGGVACIVLVYIWGWVLGKVRLSPLFKVQDAFHAKNVLDIPATFFCC